MNETLVSHWMATDIIAADPHTRLHDALRTMNNHQIRSLPVVEDGRLAGIVTKRDLLRADVTTVMKDIWDQYRIVGNLPLANIMTREVITIRPQADMVQAAQRLLENKITCLPVLDEDEKMIGILTSSDIFRFIIADMKNQIAPTQVKEYMTRAVETISPDDDIMTAHRLMSLKRFRALPVMQEGLLVGIVTRTDLLSAAPSVSTSQGRQDISIQIFSTPVRYLMTSSPLTIGKDQSLAEAAQAMLENKIHSLPVMDADHNLCGIITETDLFQSVYERILA